MRGTIGGLPGENLTPPDLVRFVSAYAEMLKRETNRPKVVMGRDGRISGNSVQQIAMHTLLLMGVDVVDLDLSTTPTVEMAVIWAKAQGGIILTASHNPAEWNALKFLNEKGEFISEEQGLMLIELARQGMFEYSDVQDMGQYSTMNNPIGMHVGAILDLPVVDVKSIKERNFHVVVDCINSTGSLALPALLNALGCTFTLLNSEINGQFAHNPEPLPGHLRELMSAVVDEKADMGIAVDPDVDRLALVSENGEYFGEEYTLVAAAQAVLKRTPGATVSNLSSTRALRDITESEGNKYYASPVGEVHVVKKMKEVGAVIGGEGNGGIIYPELHYGRDALAGVAIILSEMAGRNIKLSEWKSELPVYCMSKNKITLERNLDIDALMATLEAKYRTEEIDRQDGLKIYFPGTWVHLRKSNTEPVLRIYTEAGTQEDADELCERFMTEIQSLLVNTKSI